MTSSTAQTPIPNGEASKRPFIRLRTFFTSRSTTPLVIQPSPAVTTTQATTTTTTTTAVPQTRYERGGSFDYFPRLSPFQTPSTAADDDTINYSRYANSLNRSSGETPVAAGMKVVRTKSITKRLQIEIPRLPTQFDQQYQWIQQHQQQQQLRHVSSERILAGSSPAANTVMEFFPQQFGMIKSSPVEFIALPFMPPVGSGGRKETSKAEMKVVAIHAEVCPPMPRVFKQPRTLRFSTSNSDLTVFPHSYPQPSGNTIDAALLQQAAVCCSAKPPPVLLQHHIYQDPVRLCVQSRGCKAGLTTSATSPSTSDSALPASPVAASRPSAPMGRTRPRLYSLRACDKPLIDFDPINYGLLLPLPPRRARHSHSSPILDTLPSPALSEESPPPAMPSFSSTIAATNTTVNNAAANRANSTIVLAVELSPNSDAVDAAPPALVIGPAPPSRQQAHAKPPARTRSLSRPRLPCLNDRDRPSMASLMLLSDEPATC
ncbi:hypothetical protein HK100_006268 [Physocladia obscura]|uniref:Uncharacterized protein n=1 Tax=Physocladia obscura TaxID=109957 RepID=A0AAD5XIM0_9FUNG|nr:hypothetical protein HK100_006268 [Physocladia obscura]